MHRRLLGLSQSALSGAALAIQRPLTGAPALNGLGIP